MSEKNKEIVRRFLKAYDEMDWDAWKALAHPDHQFHIPMAPGPVDFAGHLGMCQGFRQAFPEMDHLIDEMVAEGDRVGVRGRLRITHGGEFQGIPPTGKTIEIGFMDFIRIEDGKNREEWVELDAMKLMGELGAGSG